MTNKRGRPPKYNGIESPVVQKIVEGLKYDFTVGEACAYAGISRQTFYDWQAKYSEFSDIIERSQMFLATVAKKTIATSLLKENSFEKALKYLERKQPQMYGKRKAEQSALQPPDVILNITMPEGYDDEDEKRVKVARA